jgi:hypothetical protein
MGETTPTQAEVSQKATSFLLPWFFYYQVVFSESDWVSIELSGSS